jgi:site-specific recombinase XerD
VASEHKAEGTLQSDEWLHRFVDDMAVVRSAATVHAYAADVRRWISFCARLQVDPFRAGPRMAIAFIRCERERLYRPAQTVGPRTIVRRLSAIRQWYAYLALQPEETGVHRNPIPSGSALRSAAGVISGRPALLRFDQTLPQALSADEISRFIDQLTATQHRDQAIVWLLKDGGMRINEVLQLRLRDISWSNRILTTRATKNKTERLVPITQEAALSLSSYLRFERPKTHSHMTLYSSTSGGEDTGSPSATVHGWQSASELARRREHRVCMPMPSAIRSQRIWPRLACLSMPCNEYLATDASIP